MIISLDIETSGLEINTNINFVGLYSLDILGTFKCFQLPQDLDELRKTIEHLKASGFKFLMHNGKFDSGRLKYSYNIDVPIDHDTMFLGYLMSTADELKYKRDKKADRTHRQKWLSLKGMAQRILGVPDWDVGKDVKTSTRREDVEPYLYCDVKYTYELYMWFKKHFPQEKYKTYRLMIKAANVYRDVEVNGLPINYVKLEETRENYSKLMSETEEKLKAYADINYNSAPQLQELLFDTFGLPIKSVTDKGVPSTDIEALSNLLGEHPIIPLILDYRKYKKALEFCVDWKEKAIQHSDGYWYLHSNFNLHGTVTGRTSSDKVNLQQIPRDKTLKSLFQAPNDEWELVCEDFSQLELRMAALIAGIKSMKDSYNAGEDLHTKMASIMAGKPISEVTKEERSKAKAANFGFLYGMQASTFVEYAKVSYGVVITQEEADNIRYHFFNMYPELLDYYDATQGALLGDFKVTSIMGREYEINPSILLNRKQRQEILRCSLNFPVQSAGSDYVLCGLISAANDPELKDNIRIGATVHDSVIFLVKKGENMVYYINKVKSLLENNALLNSFISVKPDFPIVVDVEIGPLGKGVSVAEYIKSKGE